jgi:uncharacterized protein YndB with AHSA1/START domain
MIINKETIYSKDLAAKKIFVTREFDAAPEQVWKAWTEAELLDQWWAPRPYKAVTKSMNFSEGGRWSYYMEGPDGSRHYCLADYKKIVDGKSYTYFDAFCDENGNLNLDFPRMDWKVEFRKSGSGTKVNVEISFATEADLEKIIEMGFKEGFAMAHGNLDELLAK